MRTPQAIRATSSPSSCVQDICSKYFSSSEDYPQAADLAWALFLVAKFRLLQQSPDLVSAYGLLICVLAFLLQHVPSESPLASAATSGGAAHCLQTLAAANKASTSSSQACPAAQPLSAG